MSSDDVGMTGVPLVMPVRRSRGRAVGEPWAEHMVLAGPCRQGESQEDSRQPRHGDAGVLMEGK